MYCMGEKSLQMPATQGKNKQNVQLQDDLKVIHDEVSIDWHQTSAFLKTGFGTFCFYIGSSLSRHLSRHAIIFCPSMQWGWMSSRSAKWQAWSKPAQWTQAIESKTWIISASGFWDGWSLHLLNEKYQKFSLFLHQFQLKFEHFYLVLVSELLDLPGMLLLLLLVLVFVLLDQWDQICNVLLILAQYLLHVGHWDCWSLPHAVLLIASSLLHKTSLSTSASRCSSLFLTSTACWSLISEKVWFLNHPMGSDGEND